MTHFAVIDTETNWLDQVMSIGVVVAQAGTFRPVESRYYILPAFCEAGGMYSDALLLDTPVPPACCTRQEAMQDLLGCCAQYAVGSLFAYNARFDRAHLPELGRFRWHDIMALAAYRQHNPRIPATAELCSTGRLKRGYGVEDMLRLLSGNREYRESHNALLDALDELEIMRLLAHPLGHYPPLK